MLRSFAFSLAIIAALFGASSQAAPITFRFQATVDDIADTIPFDSGLEVYVGVEISGIFTFDPQIAIGEPLLQVVQPYAASLWIDGQELATPPSISDFTLESSNDAGITDFPPAQIIDTIESFSTLGPVDSNILPNVDSERSLFRISLFGNTSILENPEFPADSNVWNTFEYRRSVSINLRGKSGGSLAFAATIDEFVIVPEPASLTLVLFVLSALFRSRRD